MKKPKLSDLAPEQAFALHLWQSYQGRNWKTVLETSWTISTYLWGFPEQNCYLQQIRNQKGPQWLRTLPDSEFTEESWEALRLHIHSKTDLPRR
jgi:hypothetical protein